MVMTIADNPGRMTMAARDDGARCSAMGHALGICATCIGAGTRGELTAAEYREQRAICDAAAAYAESIMCEGGDKRRRNYLTKEEAIAPVYAACDNEMRGRVEQYELLNNPPERFVAYLSEKDGRLVASVWTGLPLGRAMVVSKSRRRGANPPLFSYRAWIAGRVYHGRSQGEGMPILLRETAESKRNREAS